MADDSIDSAPAFEEIFGISTASTVRTMQSGRACLIQKGSWNERSGMAVQLTEWREIPDALICRLRTTLLAPETYWCGFKVFRRLPHRPDILLECHSEQGPVKLAFDLTNPGMDIQYDGKIRGTFLNKVDELRDVFKSLFSEFASPSHESMWNRETFDALNEV